MIIKDAVIPFHVKDALILKYGCDFLKNIINVQNLYIVGNENPNIDGTIFINENDIPNLISLNEIRTLWDSKNEKISYRAGWLYQQFLKLAAPEYILNLHENFLICDSDIIFVNNPYQTCLDDHFPYAKAYSGEYHFPYRDHYSRLMKENAEAGFSFINHQMVYNINCLKQLKSHIEAIHHKPWYEAIIDTLNYNEASNCSEYDLYGNWMFKYFNNISKEIELKIIDINFIPNTQHLEHFKSQGIHIVSAQAYRRNN